MLASHCATAGGHATTARAARETTDARFVRTASLVCIALIALAVCAMAYQIGATDSHAAAQRCATIGDDAARLACYDALTAPPQPAKGAPVPVLGRWHHP